MYDFERKVAWRSYNGGSYGGKQVRGGGCKKRGNIGAYGDSGWEEGMARVVKG